MSSPPKEKRGFGTALANSNLVADYYVALALQRPGRGGSGNV